MLGDEVIIRLLSQLTTQTGLPTLLLHLLKVSKWLDKRGKMCYNIIIMGEYYYYSGGGTYHLAAAIKYHTDLGITRLRRPGAISHSVHVDRKALTLNL